MNVKRFYNTDLFVSEHPIIDIEAEDTSTQSDDNNFQDFKFICSNQDSKPIKLSKQIFRKIL